MRVPTLTYRPRSSLRGLLTSGAGGGLVLMASAALALVVANSPLADVYFAGLKTHLGPLSVLHWINDGLMAVFFLLVGLEIKRELLDGRLRTWPDRILPGVAALGGMILPALVYAAVNWRTPETLRGWAIPAATDIAFALGVLALLGSRVPVSLKVFLTALAILDDLGAVIVIAVFYTADLSLPMLGGAAATLAALYGLNKAGVSRLWPYLALGAVLWVFTLLSGVHATVAGVLLALTVPLRLSVGRPDDPTSPLHILEHAVSPWSAFLILPVFGFPTPACLSPGSAGDVARPGDAGRGAGPVPRQASRRLRLRARDRKARLGAAPARCELGSGLWRRRALRGRLHDEPVYRPAGLCDAAGSGSRDQDRRAARVARLHGRRGSGSAACPGPSVSPLSRSRCRAATGRDSLDPSISRETWWSTMRRHLPKRRPGTIEGRLSDFVLALTGVMLLGAMILLLLSWLGGGAEGAAVGYAGMQDS